MSRSKRIVNHTFESDNRYNCIFTAVLGAVGAVAAAGIGAAAASSTASKTNSTNKAIASENLNYQKERNAIEDARYTEETAYNRAFAEDERAYNRAFAEDEREYNRAWAENEREYNRALQDEIFAREDTSYERTAQDMSNAGLNPLSMQGTNGSGSVVSAPSAPSAVAPSAVAPSASARSGEALHNSFVYQREESAQFLNSLMSEIPKLCENFYKLDSMRQQAVGEKIKNMRNIGENLKYFIDNGLKFNNSYKFLWKNYEKGVWTYENGWDTSKLHEMSRSQLEHYNQYLDVFRKRRDLNFDVDNGLFASTSSLERTLTGINNVLVNGKLDDFTRASHDKNGNFDLGKAMRFLLLGAMNGGVSAFNFK